MYFTAGTQSYYRLVVVRFSNTRRKDWYRSCFFCANYIL